MNDLSAQEILDLLSSDRPVNREEAILLIRDLELIIKAIKQRIVL